MAWPAQARPPTNTAARTTATLAIARAGLRWAGKSPAKVAARRPPAAKRSSQALPNSVRVSTVQITPCDSTSGSGSPLIDCAVKSSQSAPEMTDTARLIQATASKRAWNAGRPFTKSLSAQAGGTMNTVKNTTPAVSMQAAKCTART